MDNGQVSLPDTDEAAIHDLRHDWKVDHHLSLAMQQADGSVRWATELVFRKGNFVEVLVFADIVAYNKDNCHVVDIQHTPQEVVCLWSTMDAKVHLSYWPLF